MNLYRLSSTPCAAATPRPPEGANPQAARSRQTYLIVLTWAFTLFNSVRVAAYLPTVWAIWRSGDSSQHSLLTWLTWMGANATMAAWLHEQNGRRFNRAVGVSTCNAVMCLVTSTLIIAFRLG